MMVEPTSQEPLRNWYSTTYTCPGCHGPIKVITYNWRGGDITFANWCERCKNWDVQQLALDPKEE